MMRALLVPMVLSVACFSPRSKDDDDETGVGGGGGGAEGATIYDIQQGNVEADTEVTLSGVVATSGLTADSKGFYVQEPDGGEYSGLYVYFMGTPPDDLDLAAGDELTVTGTVNEYYDFTELNVESVSAIEKTGSGDAAAQAVGDVSDWEPWEGVLVELSNQTVTEGLNEYGEVALSSGLKMDNQFYDFDTTSGATYTTVIGPLSYGFEEFKVNPRSEEDLTGYTAGSGGGEASVVEVQTGAASGAVTLKGVVATSGVALNGSGFFVQDAGVGADYNGLYVYLGSVEATIAVGDVLDITGEVQEYYDLTELSVSSADDVVVTSSTDEIIGVSLIDPPSDWEPYEGMLVSLDNGVLVEGDADSYGQVPLDWGILMDDMFYAHGAANGDTFDSVAGILTYSYEEWKICPRDAGDLSD